MCSMPSTRRAGCGAAHRCRSSVSRASTWGMPSRPHQEALAARHSNVNSVMPLWVLLLGFAPVAAFLPPITTVEDFLFRVALFGLIVAVVALVGRTFSLPHLQKDQRKWGALAPDAWGKLLRWSAAFSAVLGLGVSAFLVPRLLY